MALIDSLIPASTGSDLVTLITGLAWPVLIGAVVVLLLPTIRDVIRSRAFTVKAGGMEISVQQASDQLNQRLDDLRDHVIGLDPAVSAGAAAEAVSPAPLPELAPPPAADAVAPPLAPPPPPPPAPTIAPVTAGARLTRVLWVDDYPANNAFEVEALQRKGVVVDQVRSTAAALDEVATGRTIDVIITDMGRDTEGPNAGLTLIAALKERGVQAPVIIYASAGAVARTREQALAAGAYGTTSSATELMSLLAGLPAPR